MRVTRPGAVLFDRDGTLVADVPRNGDPDLVRPMPGAVEALAAVRAAGIPTAVVSNQSGVGRGLLTMAQATAVNARVEALLGPVGPWCICPRAPGDRCGCRKPRPVLVPTAATLPEEITGAPLVAPGIGAAVALLLGAA